MRLFKQKRDYSSRPLDWLRTGGRANLEFANRFFAELSLVASERRSAKEGIGRPILFPFRDDFRRLISDQSIDVLRYVFLIDRDPLLRSVGIWLLSHSANRCQLLGIEEYCDDPSPMVRKHVARALYRLEARQLLQRMSADHPLDLAVQWFAQAGPNQTDFEERLRRYSEHVDHATAQAATEAEPMSFWARFEKWYLTPPKSNWYLRRILERLRHYIHGGH